jgi:hypothetical protein
VIQSRLERLAEACGALDTRARDEALAKAGRQLSGCASPNCIEELSFYRIHWITLWQMSYRL